MENEEKQDITKGNKKLSKTALRELVFRLFFACQFEKIEIDTLEYFLQDNNVLNDNDKKYVTELLDLKEKNSEKLKTTICKYLKDDWDYSRISRLKKAAIELAILEIEKGLPYKVAINESVELIKIYEDEKASKFVNGLLASYVKDNISDEN